MFLTAENAENAEEDWAKNGGWPRDEAKSFRRRRRRGA